MKRASEVAKLSGINEDILKWCSRVAPVFSAEVRAAVRVREWTYHLSEFCVDAGVVVGLVVAVDEVVVVVAVAVVDRFH